MSKQFVVHLANKQKHLMSEELIRLHVRYLHDLHAQGALQFAGPCADGTALMILRADTEEAAAELVAGDPFSQVNYYQERKIVEVEQGTPGNQFLLEDVLIGLGRRDVG